MEKEPDVISKELVDLIRQIQAIEKGTIQIYPQDKKRTASAQRVKKPPGGMKKDDTKEFEKLFADRIQYFGLVERSVHGIVGGLVKLIFKVCYNLLDTWKAQS